MTPELQAIVSLVFGSLFGGSGIFALMLRTIQKMQENHAKEIETIYSRHDIAMQAMNAKNEALAERAIEVQSELIQVISSITRPKRGQ